MLQQHFLDLRGRDVLAPADDRVVAASLDEQVVVLVEEAAVARREPALVVHRTLAARVLAGDLFAAHEDLAGDTGTLDHVAELVADLHLHGGQDLADRREPPYRHWIAVCRGPVVIGSEHGDRGAGLGEAVGVGERHVRKLLDHAFQQWCRGLGAAVRERAKARHAAVVRFQHLADARQHRRYHHCVRDRLAPHRLHPLTGVELGQVHDPAPRVEVADQVRETGHVVRRDAHQHHLVGPGPAELDGADHIGGEVAVPEHSRLRRGGGATRVEQHRGSVAVDGHVALGTRPEGRRHEVIRRNHLVTGVAERFGSPLGHHQHPPERLDHLLQLLDAQAVVQRHEGHTGSRCREQPHGKRRVVGAYVDQCIGSADRTGTAVGRSHQLVRGERHVAHLDHDLVATARCHHVEQQEQVHEVSRQSDEGSGFAPLTGSTRPSTESAPSPAFVQSSSRPRSSSAYRLPSITASPSEVSGFPEPADGSPSGTIAAPPHSISTGSAGAFTTTTCASQTALLSFCPADNSMSFPYRFSIPAMSRIHRQ